MSKNFVKQIRTIANQIPIPPIIDKNDYRNSIFIAGSGRSGTTWLQEIINYQNEYRILFEPFYPEKVDIISDWQPFQYLNASVDSQEYNDPAKAVLSGNIRNNWVDKYNRRLFSNKRIIKDIRANLILFWMKQKFPELPIVLIMRHPCAVANSKVQANWDDNLSHYLSQEKLMEDFLNPLKSQIKTFESSFDKHICSWCIENLIPLKQFQENEIYITFYEYLCVKPEEEIKKIFTYLRKTYSPKVLKHIKIPSLETSKRSAIISGTDLVSSWRKNINDKHKARSLEILSFFGLDKIYADGDLPIVESSFILEIFK